MRLYDYDRYERSVQGTPEETLVTYTVWDESTGPEGRTLASFAGTEDQVKSMEEAWLDRQAEPSDDDWEDLMDNFMNRPD